MTEPLHAAVAGDGPPLVLVHAGVADHRMWDEVGAALADTYTVIRPDLRGFGATPPPSEGFRHRDDVAALLDRLGVTRTAIVGNSFGGAVTLDFAVHHPDRVTHLGLLSPPLGGWDWSPAMKSYATAEMDLLTAGRLAAAVELNQEMWVRGPARDWSPALRAIAGLIADPLRISLENMEATGEHEIDDEGPGASGMLDRIAVPTLVGVGDKDLPDFVAIARQLAENIAGARYVEFAGAGHLLPLERPDQVTVQLRALLDA